MATVDHGLIASLGALLRKPIAPGREHWHSLGWFALLLFGVQVVTGTLLAFYYQPAPEVAAESVRYIMRDVSFGGLVRGLHYWSTSGLLVLGLLLLAQVFYSGTYRVRAPGLWAPGVLLFGMVFLLAVTGWFLPWHNDAFWALTHALEALEGVPLVGQSLALVVRGGQEVGGPTLSRVYSAHVLLLPWLSFFLLVALLWLLARRSRSKGPRR